MNPKQTFRMVATLGIAAVTAVLASCAQSSSGQALRKGKGVRPDPSVVFPKLDVNQDGYLSIDEFQSAKRGKGKLAAATSAVAPSLEKKQKRFAAIDTNGDLKISQQEFVNAPRPSKGKKGYSR